MDASQKFAMILRNIESSQLNFCITKTPFSATISLKSSYVKRFTEESIKHEEKDNVLDNPDKEKMKEVKIENLSLVNSVKELEASAQNTKQVYLDEIQRLKAALDNEKKKNKSAEMIIVELREDLLKVKKEKHKLSDDFKAVMKKYEDFLKESTDLKKKNEEIQKSVKNKLKMLEEKDLEIESLRADNYIFKNVIDEVRAELNNLKVKNQTKNKMENKCGECDTVVENHDQMKDHMRNFHCHNKSSQYDDKVTKFEEYSCFYCGTVINSNSDLQDHLRVFIQVIESLNLNQDIDSIQCDECTAEFVVQKI